MKGFIIVNGFLKGASYKNIEDSFLRAANKKDIDLKVRYNNEFLVRQDKTDIYCKNKKTGKSESIKESLPDFVIFYDKDLFLAKAFEELSVPVFNSSEAIEICDSKAKTFLKLDGEVRMPKTISVPFTYDNIKIEDYSFVQLISEEFSYPVIVKKNNSSLGLGVYLARNELELVDIISKSSKSGFTVQEYIGYRPGEDIRVFMVGDKAVASMKRTNATDFRANAARGGEASVFELPADYEEMAKKVMKKLKLSFAGVDLLISEDGPVFIEANSNAHFGKLFETTGVDVSEKILDYVLKNVR